MQSQRPTRTRLSPLQVELLEDIDHIGLLAVASLDARARRAVTSLVRAGLLHPCDTLVRYGEGMDRRVPCVRLTGRGIDELRRAQAPVEVANDDLDDRREKWRRLP